MSFYILHLDQLDKALYEWNDTMKDIRPYYAVKCNAHPLVIERLASLGVGFDCASPGEIDLVMSYGVDPATILYANPCKSPRDIEFAYSKGVRLTTFDSVCELEKIPKDMHVILRMRYDDPDAKCQLGNKYGAPEDCWDALFMKCQSHTLVGISFHVGSGCKNIGTYSKALKNAQKAAERSKLYGHSPTLLDIGGGFTRGHLPEGLACPEYTIIAEPGRFFAERVATLVTHVIGYKDHSITIDDSIYGSFNCVVFDHATPKPIIESTALYPKKVWGCSCDGIDLIYDTLYLPNMNVGDTLMWPNMGAYTMVGASNFNGMKFDKISYILA